MGTKQKLYFLHITLSIDDVAALLNKRSEKDKAVLMPSYKFSSDPMDNLATFNDESDNFDSVKERSNSTRQKIYFYFTCKTENITSAFNLLNVHMVDQLLFSTEELSLLKLIQSQILNKDRSFLTALHLKGCELISTYTLAHHEQVKSESKSDLKDLLIRLILSKNIPII